MGIVKPILNKLFGAARKTVQSSVTSTIKSTDSTIAKTVVETSSATPDFLKGLKEASHFTKLSPETQEVVIEARKRLWTYAKTQKDSQKLYNNLTTYIDVLIKYGDDEKLIAKILKDNKEFNSYRKIKSKLNGLLKDAKFVDFEDMQKLLTNLTLMTYKDKKSFANLINSTGFKEITSGKLNLSHLKGFKSSDVIDPDYFYKYFQRLELDATKRLAAKGFDEVQIKEVLRFLDDDLLQNPEAYEIFLKKVEAFENPELLKKLNKSINFKQGLQDYQKRQYMKILEYGAKDPKTLEKVLELTPNSENLFLTRSYFEMFSNKESCKISDEIFDYFKNFLKNNPEINDSHFLIRINTLLNKGLIDEKIAKEIIDFVAKNKSDKQIVNFVSEVNEHNFEYFYQCLKKGTFDDLDKLRFSSLSSGEIKSLTEIDDFFKTDYQDFIKTFSKTFKSENDREFFLYGIKTFRFKYPQKYQELVDLKVIDLIKEGKIHPRILMSMDEGTQLLPEIKSDIQMLLRGESLVKHFDSTKDILKQTSAGDVISIKGKMYINNNGQLEPWNMTEEAFNELFPLVDRFSTKQSFYDCYFVSVLNSLYENPRTRGLYYKMFEQKGDDICVTIPAYKDFLGEIRFHKGKTLNDNFQSNYSAKHIQMLEETYARTSLRDSSEFYDVIIPNHENPLLTDNIKYLEDRIYAGHPDTVMRELLADQRARLKALTTGPITDQKKVKYIIENYANNPRYILNEGHIRPEESGHAISIKSYDPIKKLVHIVDPIIPGKIITEPLDEFLKYTAGICVTKV